MVCYELTRQLAAKGVHIDYVMPFAPDDLRAGFLNIVDASKGATDQELAQSGFKVTRVKSLLAAYQTPEEYEHTLKTIQSMGGVTPTKSAKGQDSTLKLYGEDLINEMNRFAQRIGVMVEKGGFGDCDVIHAHDWTTVPAATVAKRLLNKPLIVHVHITEVNKNSGNGVNPEVYAIEREGFMAADRIVSVSGAIKQTLIDHYGIPGEKIEVVHNGGVAMAPVLHAGGDFKGDNKIVSFMGRVTGMKGPDNFVDVAHKVLQKVPKVKFILAGTGDRLQSCIDKAGHLGIKDRFYFHGFYNRADANLFYDISDVFVLPSIMEPFGVTPLEAMSKETPTIITKQSGVAEVINHCFKADFWDVDKMASQVISLLTYPHLHQTMKKLGVQEAQSMTWEKPADMCMNLYARMRGWH